MESNPIVEYNELTIAEQSIIAHAIGWDGSKYSDPKSGIQIELVVDGDVSKYRVLVKGDQTIIAAEPVVDAEPVVEVPVQTPEVSETQTTTETNLNTEVPQVEPSDVPPTNETEPTEPTV